METNTYPEPTFENFYKAVKDGFIKRNKRVSVQEVDRYLKSEEESIKDDYEMNVGELNRGEITEAQFWIGGVSAVANCLSLCYESERT